MTNTTDSRRELAELNSKFRDIEAEAKQAWMEFDNARTEVKQAIQTKSSDLDDVVKRSEGIKSRYEALASQMASLDKAREHLYAHLADEGKSALTADGRMALKEPGAWLNHAVKAIKSGGGGGGEFKTLTTTDGGMGAGITPTQFSQAFFDRLAPRSVGLASGFTVIPTTSAALKVPRVTGDPSPDWTAENSPLPLSDTSGDSITATPKKLGVVEGVTRELWEDSNPNVLAIAEHAMVRGVSLKLDLGFFEGNPTANAASIRGLKYQSGIQTIDAATNGTAITTDVLADAVGLLEGANSVPSAIVMHPRLWASLRKSKTSTGEYLLNDEPGSIQSATPRSLFGVQVFLSSQLSSTETQGTSSVASSAYVYDANQVVAVRREDAQVTIDPWFDFRSEVVGIRITVRYDLVLPNPAAVVRIRGLLPSS